MGQISLNRLMLAVTCVCITLAYGCFESRNIHVAETIRPAVWATVRLLLIGSIGISITAKVLLDSWWLGMQLFTYWIGILLAIGFLGAAFVACEFVAHLLW
jgi:hypothetical protein